MKLSNTLLSTAIAGALFSAQAVATSDNNASYNPQPSSMIENTWLTLSGEIVKTDSDSFVINSGDNKVNVEFDDGDSDGDARVFEQGDRVTVSGKVDKDLITQTALDAQSVFVHDKNTTYVSNPNDEIAYDRFITSAVVPTDMDDMTLIGTVSKVENEIVELSTSGTTVRIDTSELDGQPLKEEGKLHLQEGDRIKVDASIQSMFFNDAMVVANNVIRMNDVSES
ncbi:NirD/YgiW/YdeI family stress tolerance protein [Alteromonas lipotrueiana]|uniref:NirD/YgiW/YdeI family stress tolerance protein n=1 Tax=Alteromonas lipotrueiana TaxID=2803815 RepID=UPI001C47D616|nr:NirD/YgiW/YdeI family stress tolerance protein [Alteromonas lipotrueiana]